MAETQAFTKSTEKENKKHITKEQVQTSLKDHVTTKNFDHPIHRRDSSSASSSFTPRTASSASLVQLANSVSIDPTIHSIHSPLTTILNKLPSLTESQQVPIRRTLELINLSSLPNHEPPALLLAHSWNMFFSDTSNSKSNARPQHNSQRDHSAILKAAEYQSGMSLVFTGVADVESLCASLSAFKMTIAQGIRDGHLVPNSPLRNGSNQSSLRRSSGPKQPLTIPHLDCAPVEDTLVIPGNGLGLIAMKVGQNLHFFRSGVDPVWEDPWNTKGGRLLIQTTLPMLDPTFESIVLLMAGGVLETDARKLMNVNNKGKEKEGGRVVGVIGSRRAKPGDRIEIWLSGPTIGTAPVADWVQCFHTVLSREINLPEIRSAKYKTHFS